jgi:hypothetical protein
VDYAGAAAFRLAETAGDATLSPAIVRILEIPIVEDLDPERVVDWRQIVHELIAAGVDENEIALVSGLSRSLVNRLKNQRVEDVAFTPGAIIIGLWCRRCFARV